MKNLVPYEKDPMGAYDAIAKSKDEPNRSVLAGVRNKVTRRYNEYARVKSNLGSLGICTLTQDEIDALLHCYTSPTKSLDDLLGRIRNDQPEDIRWHCQYCCGMSRSQTWDHYIGKAEHPEFAVYAPNLVPCCGDCNNLKKNWIRTGVREYLHFYYDNLNRQGILIAATIGIEADGVPRATFELTYDRQRTRNVIKRIFARHFDRLGLADRLRQSSFQVLSKIKPEVLNCRKFNPHVQAKELLDHLAEKAQQLADLLGPNQIESILYRAASKSPDLIRHYLQNKQPTAPGATP